MAGDRALADIPGRAGPPIMNNEKRRAIAAAGLLALALATAVRAESIAPVPKTGKTRANLLLVTIDTLRADRLGCYGGTRVQTPAIDALAGKGFVFTRAFAQATTTLPSHADILLGVTPLVHGVHDNANFTVGPEFPTLAGLLKKEGYAKAAFVGAYPLDSRFGLISGFDVYDDDYGRQRFEDMTYVERKAADVVGRALAWLKGRASPWFLWVHLFDPHAPYDPPEPFKSEYKGRPYDGEVAYTDQSLGILLGELERDGAAGRTLVILTSDHGESLGDHGESSHGFFAYNSTLWVPLIVSVPGAGTGPKSQLVGHIDIFPTVCDLLDLDKPAFLQGASLVPVLEGKELPRRALYFESLYPFYSRGWAPLTGYIDGDEKFIESPIPELYNIGGDFGELDNRAEPGRLGECRKRLADLVRTQSRPQSNRRPEVGDRQTREKLKSLGYISGSSGTRKTGFTPADDVKTLLPFHNRAMEAQDLFRKGDGAGAAGLLREILTERDDIDVAYTGLAAVYKAQGGLGDALDVLKLGRDRLPDNYEIFLTQTSYLIAAGRYAEVIRGFEAASLLRLEHDPEIWNDLGIAYSRTGKFAEAEAAFEKALSLDRDHPAALTNQGILFLSRSSTTGDRNLLEKSFPCFERALAIDPRYAPAQGGLGAAFRQKGDVKSAVSSWEKALALDPASGHTLYNLGVAYLELGEKTKARTLLLKYQSRAGASLSPEEKAKLEALIRKSGD